MGLKADEPEQPEQVDVGAFAWASLKGLDNGGSLFVGGWFGRVHGLPRT
jgi:hypothetical protein